MRVLIVGCGYVGVALGAELVRQGHEVFGVRRSSLADAELRAVGIQPLQADITRPEDLAKLPAPFEWVVEGGEVNFDLHGDGSGNEISYEKGRAVAEAAGELTAAFTGNHGWFWRNRGDAAVSVTLRVAGAYSEIKRFD